MRSGLDRCVAVIRDAKWRWPDFFVGPTAENPGAKSGIRQSAAAKRLGQRQSN